MNRLFIILLVLFFTSCSKNQNESRTTFRGVIINYSTNQGLSNVSVKILTRDVGFNTVSSSGSVVTNANGEYEIEMALSSRQTSYEVVPDRAGYTELDGICTQMSLGKLLINNNAVYNDSIYIDKQSIVNLNISNLPPASLTDTIYIRLTHGNTCSTFPIIIGSYISKERELSGAINNYLLSDTFSLKEAPSVKVSWNVRNNGLISSGEQQINVIEFSTTTHNINY